MDTGYRIFDYAQTYPIVTVIYFVHFVSFVSFVCVMILTVFFFVSVHPLGSLYYVRSAQRVS
jgi:hypothetical protein